MSGLQENNNNIIQPLLRGVVQLVNMFGYIPSWFPQHHIGLSLWLTEAYERGDPTTGYRWAGWG